MRIVRSVLVAAAVAAAPALLSASEKPVPANDTKAGHSATVQKAASTQFAAMKGIKAVPMTSSELIEVKGQHIHFVTPGSNDTFGEEGLHLVNRNNDDHYLVFHNGILSGPGYNGLCGAALKSPQLSIPGQNTTTGIGAGC